MNTNLYKIFENKLNNLTHIQQNNKKNTLLVSISAGKDSIFLIKMLEIIKDSIKNNIELQYIYVDHQWKKNSKLQIQHIINYLKCYNSSLYVYQIKENCSSETEARIIRYQIIFHHAKNNHNQIILTGHNLTDKIETFLQNLFKGTSIDGATSLSEYRENNNKLLLFRPLLNINRYDTQWLCRTFYLPIWSDQTNYYYYIKRNRIRYELLPYLKNYFSTNIEKNLNSFLMISNVDNEYLKQNTLKLYLFIRHNQIIGINYKIMKKQHISIQKRILQLFSFHHFNDTFNNTLLQTILYQLKKINQNTYLQLKWNSNKTIFINNKWLYIN